MLYYGYDTFSVDRKVYFSIEHKQPEATISIFILSSYTNYISCVSSNKEILTLCLQPSIIIYLNEKAGTSIFYEVVMKPANESSL
jgi:hypothetical protein